MNQPTATLRRIPKSIWALGFVSLLMDVSSELIHSLLPVFMVTSLGISMFVRLGDHVGHSALLSGTTL